MKTACFLLALATGLVFINGCGRGEPTKPTLEFETEASAPDASTSSGEERAAAAGELDRLICFVFVGESDRGPSPVILGNSPATVDRYRKRHAKDPSLALAQEIIIGVDTMRCVELALREEQSARDSEGINFRSEVLLVREVSGRSESFTRFRPRTGLKLLQMSSLCLERSGSPAADLLNDLSEFVARGIE